MSIEGPRYEVLGAFGRIELRRYEPRVVAQTKVHGTQREAVSEGFSILAAYIFGQNEPAARIAMTAPVTQTKESERIAMTAPVVQQRAGGSLEAPWTLQFTMPAHYTLETLPRPLDERVEIRRLPAGVFAVLRFPGLARPRALEKKERALRDVIAARRLQPKGDILYAFYNPPFTPPPLRRNEVLVEIVSEKAGPV